MCVHTCGWSLYAPTTHCLPPTTYHSLEYLPTYHPLPTYFPQLRLEPDAAQCDAWMRERLPAQLYAALFAHQREGVVFALQRGGRALIADEMGLGKSVQAICIALCYPDDWPCLILCPAGVVGNWEGQLRRWLPPDLGAEVCAPTIGKQP